MLKLWHRDGGSGKHYVAAPTAKQNIGVMI